MQAAFVHRQQSQALVERMRTWRSEHVVDLQVSLAYVSRLSNDRYAATLQFAGDGRAIPDFDTYLVQLRGSHAVIDGAPNLLPGAPAHPHWLVIRTAHFTIFHGPYQLEGTDRHFAADLEYQRSQIQKGFGVQLPPRVQLYLFPGQRAMRDVTRSACGATPGEIGCTSPFSRPPTISAVIRAIYREPIHAYQLALLPPPPGPGAVYVAPLFIAEGMAVALEDRAADPALSDYCSDLDYQPLDRCARVALPHVKPMDLLSDGGFKHADPGYAYALAGSFVKFLIRRSGDTRFGRYYYTLAAQPKDRLSDYDVAARKFYHTSARTLIQEWTSTLANENR